MLEAVWMWNGIVAKYTKLYMVKFIIALIAVGLAGVSRVEYKHSAGWWPKTNKITLFNRRKIKNRQSQRPP
ncbi:MULTISPECIES: hypothetical protein [unclassified Peribacillus]|nr:MULTISPECIES: hypothetical protein [unclassified Peribacillus]MBK5441520.1 hypothetical protein [Peribacillus sp. TH24]